MARHVRAPDLGRAGTTLLSELDIISPPGFLFSNLLYAYYAYAYHSVYLLLHSPYYVP